MSLVLAGVMERELVEVDGLLAGLTVPVPALEERLQEAHGLFEGKAVDGAKVGTAARG
jgi:hypothetical protein